MTVLITGANGFLGHYLVKHFLLAGYKVIATGKGPSRLLQQDSNLSWVEMDFTDPFRVHDVFEKFPAEVVVHAGAMANVDLCEQEQWQAYVTNVEGTLNILANAEETGVHVIFVSTDFVFDGQTGPYDESRDRQPVNFYGKTKRDAEDAVREYMHQWTIIRTVLLYGKNISGHENILTAVQRQLAGGQVYSAVDDIIRTPTYVEDLAQAIVAVAGKKKTGIYHISGKDVLTPYQMAFSTAEYLRLDTTLVKKIHATDIHSVAARPKETVFIIDKACRDLGYQPVSFEEGLSKTFT